MDEHSNNICERTVTYISYCAMDEHSNNICERTVTHISYCAMDEHSNNICERTVTHISYCAKIKKKLFLTKRKNNSVSPAILNDVCSSSCCIANEKLA